MISENKLLLKKKDKTAVSGRETTAVSHFVAFLVSYGCSVTFIRPICLSVTEQYTSHLSIVF